jgi:hypothetical protein
LGKCRGYREQERSRPPDQKRGLRLHRGFDFRRAWQSEESPKKVST